MFIIPNAEFHELRKIEGYNAVVFTAKIKSRDGDNIEHTFCEFISPELAKLLKRLPTATRIIIIGEVVTKQSKKNPGAYGIRLDIRSVSTYIDETKQVWLDLLTGKI